MVFNSKKVTDHHAIIPTVSSLSEDLSGITESEAKVYRIISNKLHASVGDILSIEKKEIKEKFTQPPKHFTEDTLLKSMEIAGNDALEQGVEVERKGLGTPATKAGIIENLIYKGFVERDKKNLVAMHKGISLVTIVSDTFKSSETTAKWEMELSDIAQGKSSKEEFLEDIENKIKEAVLTYSK